MIRAIRELQSLKGRETIPKEDRARARKNMEKLYTLGFLPDEIVYFASWVKADTVKRYCRGLEVKESTQKEHRMALLGQFASMNGKWEELEYYIETKTKLENEGMSLDDILAIKKSIETHKISLKDLGLITSQLEAQGQDWTWLLTHVSTTKQVFTQGWTPESLALLRKKTAEMGLMSLLENIGHALTREEMDVEIKDFHQRMDKLLAEEKEIINNIIQLDLKHAAKITHIQYAETLQDQYKFDINAIATILKTAEKGGDPIHVLDQLNKYLKTQELEAKLQSQQEKNEVLFREILGRMYTKEELEKEVNELHMKIGAIEERHRHSRVLQNIANLLDNPAGTELTPQNFNTLSLKLLTSIRDYAYHHTGSNATYERHVKNHVDNAVNTLNNIVSGKLT